ncbi:sensor histidine kinase [Sporosarcina sp. FSL K6-1508]|uniref:sensor histidine kinase n=1 Tax=Sporosarcina sp. FSL K6-1508 TaxID=2921553 RepID=UPI0030F770D9
MNLLFLYRYSSLVLTSIFFLLGPQSPLLFKAGVIISLGIAAWVTTNLQKKYLRNNAILKSIVLAETIGLTLLLMPTGGISSPFIWYALNPVLMAASFLTPLFCWAALSFYLGSATIIAYTLFHGADMIVILEEKSYFYLVCLLTTLLVRLFTGLTSELDIKAAVLKAKQEELLYVNKKLIETNDKYQDTLEHIMSLYHLMDNFSSEKSPQMLIKEITTSIIKCSQSDEAFFWLTDLNQQNSLIATIPNNRGIETGLKKEWNAIRGKREPFIGKVNNELYGMKVIRTSNNVGVLGIKISSSNEAEEAFHLNRTFEFLGELSEMMLERIYMDLMKDQMIVIEEQNRIANEIHDSVSQRLFGIVYSLHSLQVKSRAMTSEELNEEYQFLSQSANTTIKELRSTIYRLSSMKKGQKPYLVRLKKYLEEYSRLNDVQVDCQIIGDETLISDELKEALYRIVCETCGNAVRHGRCTAIELRLSLVDEKTVLIIRDDGIGFNLDDYTNKKEKGIGFINIKNIVSSFVGTFSIAGLNGLGTEIQIEIPNIKMLKKEEVIG